MIAQRYVGRCLGGPYDGQRLEHDAPRYPIIVYCSTSDHPVMLAHYEAMRKYQDTEYVFVDSTWVWKDERQHRDHR